MTETMYLRVPDAVIAADIDGPLPTRDGRPPLLMVGLPMDAPGFAALGSHFPDRTVVRCDPRGIGRSTRQDGKDDHDPDVQVGDIHALILELGGGPVDVFASSGGAVTALALVAAHPGDVVTLVAHEPPMLPTLQDANAAFRARADVARAYAASGFGAGMAAFIVMTSWRGAFTDAYFALPDPDPARFGLPTTDDGSRDSPLLSERSWPISGYRPDIDAIRAAPTRVVIGVGEETLGTLTGRTSVATADLLGREPMVFPSHHSGFAGGESGYPGKPEQFAALLRSVL
jgi:pimeloyl-ACP methyl ester carboxylesterase